MAQITIYDLLPLLRKGWVAMTESGKWFWFRFKPTKRIEHGGWSTVSSNIPTILPLHAGFNIKPFDGDWKDSLMEVK